jgi:hypothetical protein
MALAEDEAVAVGPGGEGRIEAQDVEEQGRQNVGDREIPADMAV